jgi:hypothetical protein
MYLTNKQMNCGFVEGMKRIVAEAGFGGLYKVLCYLFHTQMHAHIFSGYDDTGNIILVIVL